jgi:uncharacterized iron-regulated membrane protein
VARLHAAPGTNLVERRSTSGRPSRRSRGRSRTAWRDAHDPVFDASGKYLFFAVSTNAGPILDWFAQSNNDMSATSSIYLAVLAKGVVPSPLAKESDEEKGEKPKADDKKKDGDKTDAGQGRDRLRWPDGKNPGTARRADGRHEPPGGFRGTALLHEEHVRRSMPRRRPARSSRSPAST